MSLIHAEPFPLIHSLVTFASTQIALTSSDAELFEMWMHEVNCIQFICIQLVHCLNIICACVELTLSRCITQLCPLFLVLVGFSPLYIDGRFEGDLNISPEMIRQCYDILSDGVSKRVASNSWSELKLWPYATVSYIINSYLPSDVICNISIAILIGKIISPCNLSQCTPWLYRYTILSVTMLYSLIGVVAASRLGRYGGTQIINLGIYICGQIGVIIH